MDKVRSQRYDFIRAVAIIFVLFIHSMEILYDGVGKGGLLYRIEASILSIIEAGVPLFVMISGSLLLGKSEPVGIFYKKRLSRILIPFLFWSAVVCLGLSIEEHSFTWQYYPVRFVKGVLTNNIHGVFWYVYMILGLYILTPVFRSFCQHDDKRLIYIAAFFTLFVSVASELIPSFMESQKWGFVYCKMFFYYLIGYIVVRDFNKKMYIGRYAVIVMILSLFGLCLSRYYHINSSIWMMVFSIGLFGSCLSIKDRILYPIIRYGGGRICRYSYGIYLCHIIFISVFVRTPLIRKIPIAIEPFVMVLCVLIATCSVLFLFEKAGLKKLVM